LSAFSRSNWASISRPDVLRAIRHYGILLGNNIEVVRALSALADVRMGLAEMAETAKNNPMMTPGNSGKSIEDEILEIEAIMSTNTAKYLGIMPNGRGTFQSGIVSCSRRGTGSLARVRRSTTTNPHADEPYASPENRRPSETLRFEHDGHRYFATIGFANLDDRLRGKISEVFMDAGKPGSSVQHMARDGAVILSLALQHGCPIDVLRRAVTRLDDGSPAGPFGKILDLIP
jgi:hypothetical protein